MADKYVKLNDIIDTLENEWGYEGMREDLEKLPTADVVEVDTIKAWLYGMAINNVGCVIDGDFSNTCEEIIARLDGLRNFAKERGGEK